SATKKWARQMKAEERDRSRQQHRRDALVQTRRITDKEAAAMFMREAYLNVSSNGTLPAHCRQIMYEARGKIQEMTGKQLDDKYFCKTLLPDYQLEHPEETRDWDVVFDARGHFTEPHTKYEVPLGTIDVRNYLNAVETYEPGDLTFVIEGGTFPTLGPQHRYGAILFIEKEGFLPL